MDTRIRAEWDTLHSVAIHRSGMEMFFGLLEPYASQNGAIHEHEQLEHILKHEFHINVYQMRNQIVKAAERNQELQDILVKAARETLNVSKNKDEVTFVTKEFEKKVNILDSGHYFDILLLSPHIESEDEGGKRTHHLKITEQQSLSNILCLRDQQAVTDKGIFLSRMSKPQRRREPAITKILWDVLGCDVIHTVKEPGTFEGGDFIPLKDFALVGVGGSTNQSGIEQLLKYGLGFDEVGVVHQPNHPLVPIDTIDPMLDMHLDTYFNIASRSVAVGLKPLLQEAMVDIYTRTGPGEYEKEDERVDLLSYITGWGFDVVGITTLEQLSYASNFLTVRDGTILSVEVESDTKDVLGNLQKKAKEEPERYGALLSQAEKDYEFLKGESEFFPYKREIFQHGIDAYPLSFKNLTASYGAAHCLTAVLERG